MASAKKKILIAGPAELYPGCPVNPTLEARDFFARDDVEVWCSLDPSEIDRADGIVVPGGLPDVSPAYWGQENTGCHVVDREMDRAQMAQIQRAFQLHKPILGICRGMQLTAVYLGATLVQDIPSSELHIYTPGKPRFHFIHSLPGSQMYPAFGPTIEGNSGHHQCLATLPACLKATQFWCQDPLQLPSLMAQAQAGSLPPCQGADWLPEAVEQTDYPFIGLQWHPELGGELFCRHTPPEQIRRCLYNMIQEQRPAQPLPR